METVDVIAFREGFDKATFTMYNRYTGEKKLFKPEIHICCDNSLNAIDDRMGSVIWDDENSRFYWFKLNSLGSTPNSTAPAISLGDKVEIPAMVITVDYGEIQNMRIVMNEEMFDKYVKEAIGHLITEDQIKHLKYIFFAQTDMKYIISRKNKVSYMTEELKDTQRSTKHYDDRDEYDKTIHKL